MQSTGIHYMEFRYFLLLQYLQTQFTSLCNLMIFVDLKTGLGKAEDLNNSRSGIEPLRRRSNAAFISLVQHRGSLMTCQTVFSSIRSERL